MTVKTANLLKYLPGWKKTFTFTRAMEWMKIQMRMKILNSYIQIKAAQILLKQTFKT